MSSRSVKRYPRMFSPIIAITLAFMVGVLVGHYLCPGGLIIVVGLGGSLACAIWGIAAKRRGVSILAVLLMWLSLGTAAYHLRYHRCRADDIVRRSSSEPVLLRLRGEILDDSRWTGSESIWPADPSQHFPLKVNGVQTERGWVSASGLVAVKVKRPFRQRMRGEELELLGMLSRYREARNPGEFDWRRQQRFKDRLCRLTVENGAAVKQLGLEGRPLGFFSRLSRHLAGVLGDEDFSPESNSLLAAMVLGQRDETFGRLNEAFQRTGLIHFLCVSGLHLGILAGFIWFLGLILGLPRRVSALLVMTVVIFYAMLVPGRAPILRAGIVVSLLCLTEITGRRMSKLHSLAIAALVILLWRPGEIFNIGFQLSFIIVAALLVLCPRLARYLLGEDSVRWTRDPGAYPHPQTAQLGLWLWAWLVRLFSTCVIAWFVAAPMVLYYFGWFNPWAALYSIIVAPLAVATVVSGYITISVGALFPLLAEGLRTVSLGLAETFYRTAVNLSRIPGIIQYLPAPPVLLIIAFYAWLILVAVRARMRLRYNTKFLSRAWMIPPLLVLLGWYAYSSRPVSPPDTLTLHLLDVGNGQVCIVEMPNGATLAVDAGSMSAADLSERTIMPFMRSRHLRRLDGLVVSHANWDHYSSAAGLIERARVPLLITSAYFFQDRSREGVATLSACAPATAILGSGARLSGTGEVEVEVLWPPADTSDAPGLTTNDSSLVVRISYAGSSILLTGDISSTGQRQLLSDGVDLRADVLVWPHHGGLIETTAEFFQAVNPDILLVSCDAQRAKRIRQTENSRLLAGRQCYTTAESGALTVSLDRKDLEVQAFINSK